MSQLPKEWEAIVLDVPNAMTIAREVVERCYALANKPARGLTNDEIDAVGEPYGYFKYADAQGDVRYAFARAILAAHQRKQQEPETVKFRAARWLVDGSVDMVRCEPPAVLGVDMEWLPGEPQTIEVKLP